MKSGRTGRRHEVVEQEEDMRWYKKVTEEEEDITDGLGRKRAYGNGGEVG